MIASLALVGLSAAYRALVRVETESIELPGGRRGVDAMVVVVAAEAVTLAPSAIGAVLPAVDIISFSANTEADVDAAVVVGVIAAAAATAVSSTPPPPPPPADDTTTIPLLVIGIPTIKRVNDPDYVIRTLDYLMAQLSVGGMNGAEVGGVNPLAIRILVVDNTRDAEGPEGHHAFNTAKKKWCDNGENNGAGGSFSCTESIVLGSGAPHAVSTVRAESESTIVFARNARPRQDDGNDGGDANVPGALVRAQARDVADVAELAAELWGAQMSFYMFMEDDFRACPHSLRALAYGLARAGVENPDFNALRVSFGLNGGVLRGADVRALAGYLREHAARRPPDHLWVEWFAGERPQSAETKRGRPHVAFRYNLLEHFGRSSSLRSAAQGVYAFCYDELNAGVVFEVEAYKVNECGHDDVWPCWPPGDARYHDKSLILPASGGIDFEALAKAKFLGTAQTWAFAGGNVVR